MERVKREWKGGVKENVNFITRLLSKCFTSLISIANIATNITITSFLSIHFGGWIIVCDGTNVYGWENSQNTGTETIN